MAKKALAFVVLVFFGVAWISSAFAICESFSDGDGDTSVMCDDGSSGALYTDEYGNTSGIINGQNYNTNTDQFGFTTGNYGDMPINAYTDQFGNTSGTIGNNSVNCYSDSYGNSTCN